MAFNLCVCLSVCLRVYNVWRNRVCLVLGLFAAFGPQLFSVAIGVCVLLCSLLFFFFCIIHSVMLFILFVCLFSCFVCWFFVVLFVCFFLFILFEFIPYLGHDQWAQQQSQEMVAHQSAQFQHQQQQQQQQQQYVNSSSPRAAVTANDVASEVRRFQMLDSYSMSNS